MNVVVYGGFEVLLIFSLVVSNLLLYCKSKKYNKSKNIFLKFTILLVFLRFSIPFMAMCNEFVYVNFIKQEYSIEQSQQVLVSAKKDISKIEDKKFAYLSIDYYKSRISELQATASSATDRIVDLIIVFIFQTMLFPILFLWLLYRVFIFFFKISRLEPLRST